MSADGHGTKVTAGRPRVRWTALRSEPAPSPCPSVLIRAHGKARCELNGRAVTLPRPFLRAEGWSGGGAVNHQQYKKCLAAFTLIEFIGALAILSIMLAALAPVVVKQIDRAVWTQEVGNMSAISNALVLQVLRNKNVPSVATWGQAAANWLNLPVSAITNTPRNYARAFLIDTNGWFNTVTLPYTQSSAGTVANGSARLMIVSTISRALPISSGIVGNASFSNIWNTADRAKPSTWTTWAGSGEDLVIQRINLQPLFHRLILYNRDTNTSCLFAMDSNNSSSLLGVTNGPGQNQFDAYYLAGSVVGMYTNSTLLLSEVLNKDMSRVFESGVWSDQIGPGPPATIATNLDQIAYAFVSSSSPNSGNKKGDNTYGAADMLLSFMLAYSSWATISPSCFYYSGAGSNSKVPQYQIMSSVATCFGGSAFNSCTLVP